MKKIINKYLHVLLIIFVIALQCFLLGGCSKDGVKAEQDEQSIMVEYVEANTADIEDIVKLTGRIEAEDDVKVSSKIGGRVAEIRKDVGDFVQKGETIVVLETNELQNQLAQAQSALAAAEANLSANETAGLPQQLEQVRAAQEQAEANYVNAQADYDRMKALYEEDAISKQLFDGVTLKYKVAKSQYETAKEQYRLTKERLPKNVDALKAQVRQAQATVDLIQTNIQNSIIQSPVSGILSNKLTNTGEIIAAGYPIATVVNIDKVKVAVDVTAEEINKIEDNQELDVTVSSVSEEKFKGIVKIIPPASGQTRLFQVKISIDNEDHILKPGMFAEVDVKRGVKSNVVVIPKDALVLKKNGSAVFLIKDDIAVESMVKLGVTNGDYVEVIEGVEQNDKVVVKNQNLLKDRVKVRY